MSDPSGKSVAVLGAGTMGHGIAQVCAAAGYRVTMRDINDDALKKGNAGIASSLERMVQKGKIDAAKRDAIVASIRTTTVLADAVRDADIVVEAIPEKMEWKLETFREIDQHAKKDALLGTNTSSLSIGDIASAVKDPSRVIGLHFFNPVPVMELIEIVRGKATSDATVAGARAFSESLSKKSILVKDVPGFATSRLGVALGAEAIRMLEDGVASAEDIDLAMELGYRHPMGPLKLTDFVGLDVRLAILEHLTREVGPQFTPPKLLKSLVEAGKLGRKSGEGFYKY